MPLPDYFTQFSNPFGSLYGGVPTPRMPNIFGLNAGQPSGPLEGALQAFGPMMAEMFRSAMGLHGGTFMFGTDMNAFSSKMASDFLRMTNSARQMGADADRQQVEQIFRGLAVAMGHQFMPGTRDFAPEVSSAIGRLSSDASTMLPVLAAMFPDTIDRILPRGSMAVAASSFVNAGRFVIDPATGRPTSENAGFARQVLEQLVQEGPRATAGLGAGRLGQLYSELVDQGMIGSGRDLRGAVLGRDVAVGLFGSAGEGVGMSGDAARGVQTQRIRERLRSYSQAVAAINDIFAENGQSNASMAELMKGLQALTQGGMGVYDAPTLASITRTFHAASQMSGLGLAGLTQLSAMTGMALEQTGGHRGLAGPIALYGAAAGMVFADSGFGRPGPESMTRDQFVGAVIANRAAFAGSPIGNMLGAISAAGQHAAAGSDFALIAEAARRGETTVRLGNGSSINLLTQMPLVHDIARRSGLGGSLLTQLQATGLNSAEFVRNPGLVQAGQAFQRQEMESFFLSMLGGQFNANQSGELLRNLYAISGTDFAEAPSDATLAGLVGDRMGLSGEQRVALQSTLSIAARNARASSGFNMFRMHDPATQQRQAAFLAQMQGRGVDIGRMTHLMRGGLMRNITGSIVRAGLDGQFSTGLSILRSIGWVSDEDMASALESPPMNFSDWLGAIYGGRGTGMDAALGGLGAAGLGISPPPGAGLLGGLEAIGGGIWSGTPGRNPFRNNEGPGGLSGILDWAQEVAGDAGKKSSVSPGKSGTQKIEIRIAKMVMTKDGGASLNADGAVN